MSNKTIATNINFSLLPKNFGRPLAEIERGITKKFKKDIWSKFTKAINEYRLLEEGDKVAVAISGGKDSILMAKLFQELKKHKKFNFEVEFITMDPGYHEDIRELHMKNCEQLGIDINVYGSQIFEVVGKIATDMPCYMCAKMRRGFLYARAEELGCNKLALGHHYNDMIETIMLNIAYAGTFKTMMPKLKSSNFEGIELIRPMYLIEERNIIRWADYSGIIPINCACVVAAKKTSGKRQEIKELIEKLKLTNPGIEKSIFSSAHNVELGAIIGWNSGGERGSFLDEYR